MKILFILSVLVSFWCPFALAYEVDCFAPGFYGKCTDGEFEGFHSDLGRHIRGKCKPGKTVLHHDVESGNVIPVYCKPVSEPPAE